MNGMYIIGRERKNKVPTPDSIERYFRDYDPEEWVYGGWGATFRLDVNDGQIKTVTLSVYDEPEFGMYVYHNTLSDSSPQNYFILGDESKLFEMIEDRYGSLISQGLFIPVGEAWDVTKYFLETLGGRNPKSAWVNGNVLPPEALDTGIPH